MLGLATSKGLISSLQYAQLLPSVSMLPFLQSIFDFMSLAQIALQLKCYQIVG